jgi:O-methyltransferase
MRRRIGLATLSAVTRRVMRERLTYLSIPKLQRIERALQRTAAVPGAILEFGVALGGSGIILAQRARHDRPFHGFDVFGMIPAPTSTKDDRKSKERYEVIRSGRSEGIGGTQYYGYREDLLSEVEASFAAHDVPVDGDAVSLHKGLFENTWRTVDIDRIAIAHIDCDWHDPVAFCLRACADRLSPNGLLIIDDYNDYGGCRIAVDEFLATRPDFVAEPGANLILRNRAAAER